VSTIYKVYGGNYVGNMFIFSFPFRWKLIEEVYTRACASDCYRK